MLCLVSSSCITLHQTSHSAVYILLLTDSKQPLLYLVPIELMPPLFWCVPSGRTAHLVAKYRPPMPILTLVVPRLVSDALHWKLEGRHNARQCLLTRGLLPMLATPQPHGDAVLEEAILMAARMGIVKPHNHVS